MNRIGRNGLVLVIVLTMILTIVLMAMRIVEVIELAGLVLVWLMLDEMIE